MVSVLRRKLLRDMGAKRSQFVAITVTVFLGVALYAASFDAFLNLQASYQALYDDLGFADFTMVGAAADDVAPAVADVAGVAAVELRTVAETPLRIGGEHKLLGRVVSLPPEPPAVNSVLVLDGTYLNAGGDGVLVEQHMADHFDLAPGDGVEVLTVAGWVGREVRGIVASPEYLWPARSRQEVLTSPNDFGVLFATPSIVDTLAAESRQREVAVLFAPDGDAPALEESLAGLAIAGGMTAYYPQDLQPSQAALQEDVSGFGEMSFLFPVLFLGAAGLATSVLLTRLVLSQRTHIGLLRANGFRRRVIFAHYLSYGLATGVPGAMAGVVAGVLLGRAITGLYTDAISVPVNVIEFRPATVAGGIAFGLAAGALSALAPAIRAVRLDPGEAMRGPLPLAAGRASVVERIVPPLRRLPAGAKMVLRSVGRNRVRSAATATGVVLASVLILTSWGMLDTVQVLLTRQFEEVARQDAQAFVTDAEVVAELASVPGVARVEPVAQLPITIATGEDPYASSLTAFTVDTTMHAFFLDGDSAGEALQGLYLGSALRSLSRLDVGDPVTLDLGDAGGLITETVAGFVSEPLGTVAYLPLPRLAADLGVTETTIVNAAMLQIAPGIDAAEVRTAVSALDGVTAYVDAKALLDTVNRFMGLFYAFVGVMLVFGGVMAFALIYNTVSANIAERAAEVGTLKAAGVGRRTIGVLLTAENLLLVGLGVGPGLFLGYLAARGMMATFSSDLFRFDAVVRPTTFLLTGVALLAAALLSQRPVLRRVQELDVATVVRERSL